MNRQSWPRINSATGQYLNTEEPPPCERKSAATGLEGAKDLRDGDYEDPELRMVEAGRTIKILPARPIKESEYADTRYFKDMMDTPFSLDAQPSVPTEGQHWHTRMGLEEETDPQRKARLLSHLLGHLAFFRRSTSPCRPSQRAAGHPSLRGSPFPTSRENPEQISLKDLRECPRNRESSPLVMKNQSAQNRDHKHSTQLHPPQRCQSPARYGPQETLPHCKNTGWRKPFPISSDEKDVPQNNWYVGEHSRQAAEEALRRENKDGTFLVRDCSTKSRAEPYVLVVFYGNRVYNVKIRFLEKNQQFALGTGLRGDEKFNSVEDMIEHYKYFPIVLIDGKDKTGIHRVQCYLTQPLSFSRCFSPW
ncbi:cytokine-dependent hematopoietic cell linker [Prionailurus iriomotensis]